MKMKKGFIQILTLTVIVLSLVNKANAQALRINLPTLLVGSPNIGAEFTLSQRLTVSGDVLWTPYMFKANQSVFRVLVGTAELRYYVKPNYYYTNDLFDGFYLGPYAMYGNFNVGLNRGGKLSESPRYEGWGVSAGVSFGYKFFLSKRLRLDVNAGLGYAHLQYDTYRLGGENAYAATSLKDTRAWVGPTKFGVNLVYNLFR